jgi:hypothetical protein
VGRRAGSLTSTAQKTLVIVACCAWSTGSSPQRDGELPVRVVEPA